MPDSCVRNVPNTMQHSKRSRKSSEKTLLNSLVYSGIKSPVWRVKIAGLDHDFVDLSWIFVDLSRPFRGLFVGYKRVFTLFNFDLKWFYSPFTTELAKIMA